MSHHRPLRDLFKELLPGPVITLLRSTRAHGDTETIRFTGDYKSWEAAEQASTGYAAPEILSKTRAALLKVKAGQAAFERDSITFDVMQHEFPLLAGLLRAAAGNQNRLGVLDFGGALGSSYFQCRKFLSVISHVRWSVVDQPAQVACGKADFANEELSFYPTIEECLKNEQPNVLLLSSILQYLPKPYDFLDAALARKWSCIIVDRTGFIGGKGDLLTVQHVPDWIYRASYPAWFLSEERFLGCFRNEYDFVASFQALDDLHPEGRKAKYKGFIFTLKR